MQVLSKSVTDAFNYFNDPCTLETRRFTEFFDKMFDCLNVRNLTEWKQKNKPDLKPYTSPDDSRLKVCVFVSNCYCNKLVIIILAVVGEMFSWVPSGVGDRCFIS